MDINIKQYQHPGLFYILSTLIPWGLWFIVAYLSHSLPNEYVTLISVLGFLGLLAPLVIALLFILPTRICEKTFLVDFSI